MTFISMVFIFLLFMFIVTLISCLVLYFVLSIVSKKRNKEIKLKPFIIVGAVAFIIITAVVLLLNF